MSSLGWPKPPGSHRRSTGGSCLRLHGDSVQVGVSFFAEHALFVSVREKRGGGQELSWPRSKRCAEGRRARHGLRCRELTCGHQADEHGKDCPLRGRRQRPPHTTHAALIYFLAPVKEPGSAPAPHPRTVRAGRRRGDTPSAQLVTATLCHAVWPL